MHAVASIAELHRLEELDQDVRAQRRSGAALMSTVATVVNRLPPAAHLSRLDDDAQIVTLEGQAPDVRTIAQILQGLQAAIPDARPSLGWLRAEPATRSVRFSVRLGAADAGSR